LDSAGLASGALVRAAAAQWSSGRGEISHKSRLSTLRRKDPEEEEEEEEEEEGGLLTNNE